MNIFENYLSKINKIILENKETLKLKNLQFTNLRCLFQRQKDDL